MYSQNCLQYGPVLSYEIAISIIFVINFIVIVVIIVVVVIIILIVVVVVVFVVGVHVDRVGAYSTVRND